MTTKQLGCSMLAIAALSVPSMLHAQSTAENDRAFTDKVSQGGLYEVRASRYASMRATAPDVKDLASSEVHDHELVDQNLKKIAKAERIMIVPSLNVEFQERLAKLKAVPGPEFDAAYIADMEAIHDKDEKLFAQAAIDGSESYKIFAHQTDLIVKRHIGALHGLDK